MANDSWENYDVRSKSGTQRFNRGLTLSIELNKLGPDEGSWVNPASLPVVYPEEALTGRPVIHAQPVAPMEALAHQAIVAS